MTPIPIRITTKVECPCGSSYRYGEDGPDPDLYHIWSSAHEDCHHHD